MLRSTRRFPVFLCSLLLPLCLLASNARANPEQAVAYQINPAHSGSILTAGPLPPL